MSTAEQHAERVEDRARTFKSRPDANRPGLSISGVLAVIRHPLVVTLLSLAALAQIYRTASALPGRIHEEDFADYYAAAIIMQQRANPYRTSLSTVGPKLGLHSKSHTHDDIIPETPAFLLMLKALGRLPLTQAYWTWITINFAALIASLYLLLGPSSGIRPLDASLMAALAFIYPPTIHLFMTAQSQALVILALALIARWLTVENETAVGLVLGGISLLRGYPSLLGVYLLFTRRWRAALVTAAVGLAGIALTSAAMGWQAVLDFPLGLAAAAGDRTLFRMAFNVSPRSFVWRVIYYLSGLNLSPGGDLLAVVLGFVASIVFLAFTVRATVRRRARSDGDLRLFSLWVITSVIVLPFAWLNYGTLLLVCFALIASAATHNRASARAMWAAMISYFLSLFAFGGLLFLRPEFPFICLVLVGESKSFGVMAGYLSAYWFAIDET